VEHIHIIALILAVAIPLLNAPLAVAAFNSVVGYAGQYLKAHPKFPVPVAHLIMATIGFGLYAAMKHPTASDTEWWANAVAWTGMGSGFSSMAASMGIAPKTNP
jgi:hypothetical protein